jgi:branched-chain amino acid transport system permease protein
MTGALKNSANWPVELLIPLTGLALAWMLPDQLGFLAQVATTAVLVLALDLVTGYAGIVTLGHAAFFGVGAYAAGLFAIHLFSEPISGLLAGGLAGMLLAALSGILVLRARGLSLIMMTIAVAQIVLEIANKSRGLTGGDDGLSGIELRPIFGMFPFDIFGRTGFVYSLAVLTLCMFVLRRVMRSPFGLTCEGIREDRLRMSAMGCNVKRHLTAVYALGGLFAGVAGALSAQTVQVVGLHSLSFSTSAEALVMLILGGTGRLWGALIGTLLFMSIHHVAAELDPFRWMFTIGGMLIAVVLIMPGGIVNSFGQLKARLSRKRAAHG